MKRTKRIFSIFIGTLVLSLLIVANVWAFGIGNVDGVWGYIDGVVETSSYYTQQGASCSRWATGPGDSPTTTSNWDTGIQTGSTLDENQVRYGLNSSDNCLAFGSQSGFGFNGVNTPTPDANDRFFLGIFTHYNNPVYSSNSFGSVPLTVNIPITCEDNSVKNFSFTSTFTLDETSNTAGTCIYPGSSICPDKVTVTQPTTQTFSCSPGEDYTVNILGFTQGTGCDQTYSGVTTNEFITEESTDNVACLWAEIDRPNADAAVTKSCTNFGAANPYYTITVTNSGPGTALGVKVVDTLPDGVSYGSYTSTRTVEGVSTAQGTCSNVSGTITCNLNASLPETTDDPTAKWEVVVYVDYSTGSNWTNSVNLTTTSLDSNLMNNTATAACSSSVDVSVMKDDGDYETPYPSLTNPNFDYTLTVTNAGPDTAQNVRVVDTLDFYTDFDSIKAITVDGLIVDTTVCRHNAGTVSCDLGAMAAGSAKEIKFWVNLKAGVPTAGLLEIGDACSVDGKTADICNTVNVYTDSNDTNLVNNISVEPKDVGAPTAVDVLYFEGSGAKNSVILEWATGSELDTLGFNLYRRGRLDGTMNPINQLLVQAESVGLVEGSTYTFRVDGLKAGKYYYFWLEDVDVYGNSTLHGPIYVKAKRKNP